MSGNQPRSRRVTIRFTDAEVHGLESKAKEFGLKLSDYARGELLKLDDISRENAVMLANQERTRELLTRVAAEQMDDATLGEILAKVDAIDDEVFVRRALRKKK